MRELIVVELLREGCEVREAANGWDLLACIDALVYNADPPMVDLIIADVRMPGAGGMEALTALQTASRRPPVILISAFGDAEMHTQANRLGAAAFFDKPFDLDLLRSAVRNLAMRRSAVSAEDEVYVFER